jgi:hypothetical protein
MSDQKPQLLRRKQASEYLREIWGLERTVGTLTQDAFHGRGPDFVYINGVPYYQPSAIDAWIEAQLKPTKQRRDHKAIGGGMRTKTAPRIVRPRSEAPSAKRRRKADNASAGLSEAAEA